MTNDIEIRQAHIFELDAEPVRHLDVWGALGNAALQELAAQGIARSHVCTAAENRTAQQFCEHIGWRHRTNIKAFSYCDADACHAD